MINSYLLKILCCPICNKKLNYIIEKEKLICNLDKLEFSIKKGIPILIFKKSRVIQKE